MYDTYSDYLNLPLTITFEEAQELHKEILEQIIGDEDGMELYRDLIETATQYAHIRAQWAYWDREERMKQDLGRTYCHDSLIVKFNQLARYLEIYGKSRAWRDRLGDNKIDPYYRKTIGDFGCYLVFINSIMAR